MRRMKSLTILAFAASLVIGLFAAVPAYGSHSYAHATVYVENISTGKQNQTRFASSACTGTSCTVNLDLSGGVYRSFVDLYGNPFYEDTVEVGQFREEVYATYPNGRKRLYVVFTLLDANYQTTTHSANVSVTLYVS